MGVEKEYEDGVKLSSTKPGVFKIDDPRLSRPILFIPGKYNFLRRDLLVCAECDIDLVRKDVGEFINSKNGVLHTYEHLDSLGKKYLS